jgi:hypothetical protein
MDRGIDGGIKGLDGKFDNLWPSVKSVDKDPQITQIWAQILSSPKKM